MDLTTQYLDQTLTNPIVVASCGLTKTMDQIKACEDAGAGAVVMKSLFEEQIRKTKSSINYSQTMHPEAMEYLRAEIDMLYGPREYLDTIKKAKKSVSIPIIASVNCYSSKWWTTYAQQLEAAGADALELNVYVFPYDFEKNSNAIENSYLEILQAVIDQVEIPISIKLSPYFTALGSFAEKLDKQGADGLVLFNRFIQPDIDIDKQMVTLKASFDDPIGFSTTLRWIALLSQRLNIDLAASGNIRNVADVIKQLLAGATVVQIASVLYQEGLGKIEELLAGLKKWMADNQYSAISDFRGKLNQKNTPQPDSYIRAQYIKAILEIE